MKTLEKMNKQMSGNENGMLNNTALKENDSLHIINVPSQGDMIVK